MNKEFDIWFHNVLERCVDLGICYQDSAFAVKPMRVSQQWMEQLTIDLILLINLVRRISLEHFDKSNGGFRADQIALILKYKNLPRLPVIMRPDGIIIENKLKIIDLNVDSAIGGIWEVDFLQNLLQTNPLLNFTEEKYLSPKKAFLRLINEMIEKASQEYQSNEINLVFVGASNTSQYYTDQAKDICSWINENTNCKSYYKRPELLRIKEDLVSDESRSYHILYRDTTFFHPENIMRPMFDIINQAAKSRTIVLSDPIDLVIEQKLALALLSAALDKENEFNLDSSEKYLVEKYIPWTRLVENTEVNFKSQKLKIASLLKERKNAFVLKRCQSHEGNHVYIGAELEQKNWQDLVDNALKKYEGIWVVQENLISNKYSFKYYNPEKGFFSKDQHYTFSPFMYGQYCGGALIRIEQDSKRRVLALPTNSEIGTCGIVMV